MRVNPSGWYIPDESEPDPVSSQRDEGEAQIERAIMHIPRRGFVVQAGGRVGLWPRILAKHFRKVLTLEPDPVNYACLEANVLNDRNVIAVQAALGERRRYAYLATSPLSTGEHYIVVPPIAGPRLTRVAMTTIDDLALEHSEPIDAIFLDVEGFELNVLEGARGVLEGARPTLILEENACCHRYGHHRGDLVRWLRPIGYEYAGSFSKLPPEIQNDGHFRGADLIFVPR